MGVSGPGREGVGVAEQCVLANAACTAHHERQRELTWPDLAWPDLACRSSCPHAPHTCRRRRCPIRCPTSLCGAAATRCCCSGRWVQLPADTACLSLQVPPDRIAAAVLGGAAGFVLFVVATAHYCRCCRCLRSSQCRICSSGAHMPLAPSALLLILTAGCRRPACAAEGRLALVGHRQRRRLYHRSGR